MTLSVPRVELALTPTPIVKLDRLSRELDVELWVKRDDTAFRGGSHAGLLMARQLFGLRADVVSVPIAREAARVREYITGVIERAASRYGLGVTPPDRIDLLDGYQGVGRADVRPEELATVVDVAQREGIVLDPVYTSKAFGALLDVLRRAPAGSAGASASSTPAGSSASSRSARSSPASSPRGPATVW
jgi:1-aminocyclopropane-1-carboxylate deaminase/D-cysteine desulfhydrase-like pyridoxal-dependent ACC family enzyme